MRCGYGRCHCDIALLARNPSRPSTVWPPPLKKRARAFTKRLIAPNACRTCPFGALPWEVKQLLQQRRQGGGGGGGDGDRHHPQQHAGNKDVVTLEELGPEGEAEAWAVFNRCLEPVVQVGKGGRGV